MLSRICTVQIQPRKHVLYIIQIVQIIQIMQIIQVIQIMQIRNVFFPAWRICMS